MCSHYEELRKKYDKLLNAYQKLEEENRTLREKLKELEKKIARISSFTKPKPEGSPKKPGRKRGHKGVTRGKPERVDETRYLPSLRRCPDCGHEVSRVQEERKRYVEDIIPRGFTLQSTPYPGLTARSAINS